jgi:hypothetical protein
MAHVDLPLRLDASGAAPTTPQGQPQNVMHISRGRRAPSLTSPTPMAPRPGSTATVEPMIKNEISCNSLRQPLLRQHCDDCPTGATETSHLARSAPRRRVRTI